MSIHNTEMQIQIDDVYACPGHCPGCALSSLERKGYEPDVSLDTLHLIYVELPRAKARGFLFHRKQP